MEKMRFIKKRRAGVAEDAIKDRQWMTTFNDMVTLLMVFFVLLFSMGNIDVLRFKHFQNALQSAIGVLHEGQHAPVGIVSETSSPSESASDALSQNSVENNTVARFQDTIGLEAEYTPKGIHLTLDDRLLFSSGSARLTDRGKAMLDRVAQVIKPLQRRVRIEGHTDNRPISNNIYSNNWELSTARAVSVVKYMIHQQGMGPHLFSAAGYGDSRPRVVNDTEINMSKNRRVEIILGQIDASNNIQ